jgi:hypothetical protein
LEVERPRLLILRGRHRLAEYELRFELHQDERARTALSAVSSARFLGLSGRLYRLLVIGTGGHVLAVRRILGRVASRAEG